MSCGGGHSVYNLYKRFELICIDYEGGDCDMGWLYNLVNPDERRWRQEARDDAEEYRRKAREELDEAKGHYEDFKEYQSDAKEASRELSKEMKEYLEYKASVLDELGTEVGQTLQDFKDFKIEVRVPAEIKINANITSDLLRKATAGISSSSIISTPSVPTPSIFKLANMLSDPFQEKDRAMEEMFQAQNYCSEMNCAATDMKGIRDKLRWLREDVRDSRTCIEEMMGKIRKILGLLNTSMQKDSFTKEEAEYFNAIYKIAGMIKKSLEYSMIGDDGFRTEAYRKYGERMKALNKSLPSAPSLTDRSWLSILASYDA